MAKTLLDLADELERKAKKLDAEVSDETKKLVLTIVGDLAYKTPVDTSKALSNWIVTLDSPYSGTINAHYAGKSGSSYQSSAQETINRAKAVLDTKSPGQAVFITNNLPYIKRLNDGYSAQQPAGFVERAILHGRIFARKFKLRG